MKAAATLAPVIFMLGLGYLSKVRKWITPEQKEGANKVAFGLLFPIMVFNLLASSTLKPDIAGIVALVLACYCLFYLFGRTVLKKYFAPYDQIAPFLLTTAEGGNLALPLYLSIVGASSPEAGNPILLDLAGVFFCFLIIPVIVAASQNQAADKKQIFKSIVTSPMVIAAVSGLVVNLTGIYGWLEKSAFFEIYSNVISMATAPIIPIVLFVVGYNLNFSIRILKPAFKLVAVRLVLFIMIIVLLYLIFPQRMADAAFAMAVYLYFLGPVGFGVIPQIDSLLKTDDDKAYCSVVISLNMIVILIVYVVIVLLQH